MSGTGRFSVIVRPDYSPQECDKRVRELWKLDARIPCRTCS